TGSASGGGPSAIGARSAAGASPSAPGEPLDAALAIVTGLAHPERLARARGRDGSYLLAGGTGAALPRDSSLRGQPWLAIAEVARGRAADGSGAVIRSAVPIDERLALEVGAELVAERTATEWTGGRVTARRIRALGAIELSSTPVAPTAEEARACIAERLAERGVAALHWSPAADALRRRLALVHRELGGPWPAVDDAALAARLDEWLAPELDGLAAGRPLERLDLHAALQRLLPWPEAARLDELAPVRIEVPSGSLIAVDYPPVDDPTAPPVLAAKLQECFGWETTPRLVDGRVPVLMHLLSPARRPLAVTDDLASFWSNAYAQVRAEMRGRYPKHPWPEDPRTAPPRRGTTRSGR
ncbi:MAG: ATP-dependent helicase HrpB, partial [Microbacteriaceae bacterium]|nr:ATP-dependent helicase HrpB [Microbacteriaceae bacterium]